MNTEKACHYTRGSIPVNFDALNGKKEITNSKNLTVEERKKRRRKYKKMFKLSIEERKIRLLKYKVDSPNNIKQTQ